MKHRTRTRIAFAVTLAFALIITELSARFWLVLHSPDVSPEAQIVSREDNQIGAFLSDYGAWLPGDFHGTYINVDDHARRTTGQPAHYDHTVWLFGNSGLFDPYVADAQTMASQLQALVLASGWRVVNLGVGGYKSADEYKRLTHTPIEPGDVVIFVDGAMDADVPSPCVSQLATFVIACQIVWHYVAHPADVSGYPVNIGRARAYTISAHAEFFHFVQPTLDPLPPLPGLHLYAPPSDFINNPHLNAHGDAALARSLFDALTTF